MPEDPHVNRNGSYVRPYYTVATLPTAASMAGELLYVTDATVNPWTNNGEVIVGGGTTQSRARSDGTSWRLHF